MVAALLIVVHMTYLIFRYGYWQMYYVIGAVGLLIGLSVAAVLLSRRGRATLSGWLIICRDISYCRSVIALCPEYRWRGEHYRCVCHFIHRHPDPSSKTGPVGYIL